MRNSLLYKGLRRLFGLLGSVDDLFQTVRTVKMEATRVLCECFFLLENGKFGLSEG